MNILHITTSLSRGGAAKSLCLLHRALQTSGHHSRVLVGRAEAPQEAADMVPPIPWWGRLSYHGLNLLGLNYAGIPQTGRLAEHPWFAEADLVHYHNLHGGYFNYLALPRLTRLKPSVWTLHDMWALTGHCAHSFECGRWRSGCGRCPHPEIDPPIRRDATRVEWKLKRRVYERSSMLVTVPSGWLTGLARESMLGVRPICHIPNGVDTDLFRPQDKYALRQDLAWPNNATILLFAAESLNNPFKHFALLLAALGGLSPARREKLVLAVLGEDTGLGAAIKGIRTIPLGYQADEATIARFYTAADLFVYPTRADNQPRVLLEAMACGCPSVASDVGGVAELIRHGETGYLTRAGDANDLRRGIESLVDDPLARVRMAENGRRLVEERHCIARHLADMQEIYREAIGTWRAGAKGR